MGKDEEELEKLQEELNDIYGSDKVGYGSPEPEKKDNMFKFFKEILSLEESWKVGNLEKDEIGKSKLSVKSYLELARYAEAEGLDDINKYFVDKADIISSVSMGRKGFMPQLFVTQIKKEQKLKQPEVKNKGWFGANKPEGEN